MEKAKFSAKQVAKWFINRARESTACGGELLTQLKLQKLMYYAQGFYFVFENKPLFSDVILARQHGPVVDILKHTIKKYGDNPIKEEFKTTEDITNQNVINILEFVFDKVAQYTALTLRQFTHEESPWQNTEQGKQITNKAICEFFRNKYITNFDKYNKFNITEEDIFNVSFGNIYEENKSAFEELAKC